MAFVLFVKMDNMEENVQAYFTNKLGYMHVFTDELNLEIKHITLCCKENFQVSS